MAVEVSLGRTCHSTAALRSGGTTAPCRLVINRLRVSEFARPLKLTHLRSENRNHSAHIRRLRCCASVSHSPSDVNESVTPPSPYSVVMKFGGSSVANAKRMKEVADLISSFPHESPVVILSAMGKTTNNLLKVRRGILSVNFVPVIQMP